MENDSLFVIATTVHDSSAAEGKIVKFETFVFISSIVRRTTDQNSNLNEE